MLLPILLIQVCDLNQNDGICIIHIRDVCQVTLHWDMPDTTNVTGFRVIVDDQPFGGTLNKNMREVVVGSLRPGMVTMATSLL